MYVFYATLYVFYTYNYWSIYNPKMSIIVKICVFLWCKSEIKKQILIGWDLKKKDCFEHWELEQSVWTTETAGSEVANAKLQTHRN